MELIYDTPRLEEKLLVKKAKQMSLKVRMINVKQTPLVFDGPEVDVSLIRCISMFNSLHAAAVREGAGVKAVNSSNAIMNAGDKILTLSRFKAANIPFPRTALGMYGEAVEKAI